MPEHTDSLSAPQGPFERVLAEILLAEEAGRPLDPSDVLRTHPDLEEPLREYFRDRDDFDRLAPRLAPTAHDLKAPPQPGPAAVSAFGPYKALGQVGEGARGVVYRVSDPELNRPLAVKVLRPELRDQADAACRLLLEAQVTGQLQHPGIVPVHAVGHLADGRPYFVMRLVEGRDLADLLARQPAPADDRPHFLAIFQQVCQAVAYAHSRGVIHRDLKPRNIMVGAFGEVQVMDWGFAKVLAAGGPGRPDPGQDTWAVAAGGADTVCTVRTATAGLSSADGLVMGTFAYMAPEQAQGRVEDLDARADVFGLGAILCEVLTGRPPYVGLLPLDVYRMAVAADLADAFARLEGCGADADLVGVARECLAPDREGRPRDAGVVAERLTAYLAAVQERLRQAELDKVAAQARAEEALITAQAERRARRLTVGLAAAVLAVVASLTVGGLWLQRQQAEEARQAAALRQDVAAALAQADRLRQGAHFQESRNLLQQVRQRLGADGPADLREQVDQALANTQLARRLDAARLRALTDVGGGKFDFAAAGKEYEAAFKEAGLGQEGEDAAVVAARVRASAVRAELVAALDDWAGMAGDGPRRAWLLAVARAADPEPGRARLRRPELWRDGAALAKLAGEARAAELSPQLVVALGRALEGAGEDPILLLRRAQARHPNDLFLNLALAVPLHLVKQRDEAISYYRAALALRPVAGVHTNLGLALYETGNREEAVSHFRDALHLDPSDAVAHSNLGMVLHQNGNRDEALRHYREAVRLDPGNAIGRYNLGHALHTAGQLDEAIRQYEQALRITWAAREAAAAHSAPGRPVRRPWYVQAFESEREATFHSGLGHALYEKGRLDEAIRHGEEAVRLAPANAIAHTSLGLALHASGRRDAAVWHYEEALRINPSHATAHCGLGRVLYKSGKLDEAISQYVEALCLDPEDATAHSCLGIALQDKGRSEEAISHCREAVRINPKNASFHYNLGVALYAKRRFDEALHEYLQAVAIKPRYGMAHCNLGEALYVKGWVAEAVGHFEKAIDLDQADAVARHNLGVALRDQGRFTEAVVHFKEAIGLNTRYANAYGALGETLLGLGRFAEARAATARALEFLAPNDSRRVFAKRQLRRCESMLVLESRLPAILSGKDRPAGAAEALDFAWVCQATKHHGHAVRFYADAFAADPKLADDAGSAPRSHAACCAALAASALMSNDPEQSRLCRQALDWLRTDLALWKARAERGNAGGRAQALRVLRGWQNDPRLTAVRDRAGLAALPGPERQDWQQFWADVEALRKRLREAR
jgi:tetratricopeptide (TPR) repeat protein